LLGNAGNRSPWIAVREEPPGGNDMRRSLVILMLCALGLAPVLASENESKKGDAASATSHESDYFTFMETNDDVTFFVDSQIAMWHVEDAYFPVQFALGAVREKGKGGYKVMLGSFTLLTPDGKAYKPTSYDDIMKKYKKRQEDQNLVMSNPIKTQETFDTFELVSAPFYPETASRRMVTEGVELPVSTYARGLLYFPMPESGLEGVLTVMVETPKIDPPVAVKFRVPEKHHKDKDHDKKSGR
jgi:hypothetical protein